MAWLATDDERRLLASRGSSKLTVRRVASGTAQHWPMSAGLRATVDMGSWAVTASRCSCLIFVLARSSSCRMSQYFVSHERSRHVDERLRCRLLGLPSSGNASDAAMLCRRSEAGDGLRDDASVEGSRSLGQESRKKGKRQVSRDANCKLHN